MSELAGKHYWPSEDFSTPADDLCWHVPPEPNRDYRCVRIAGHAGRHAHEWSPTLRDYSFKDSATPIDSAERASKSNGDAK